MKILVLQLARLGDIYQSTPTLKAIRRIYPQAKIDFLVRTKFVGATEGIDEIVDEIVELDSKAILKDSIESGNWKKSYKIFDSFFSELEEVNYDRVINLSFSPLSSYLVDLIANESCEISGYTRYKDGYLAIPDDASAYFYGQVGINKFNRSHLTEVFAAVAGVELLPEDFIFKPDVWQDSRLAQVITRIGVDSQKLIVIHVGASTAEKSLSVFKWRQIIIKICKAWTGQVVLVGSQEESIFAEEIVENFQFANLVNAVGKTHLTELSYILSQATIAVGADSLVMALASLLNVKCLNISFRCVNFWETGPFSQGSRIVFAENSDLLSSDQVAEEVLALANKQVAVSTVFECQGEGFVKYAPEGVENIFCWNLIKAIYMGADMPAISDKILIQGLVDFATIVKLALEQIDVLNDNPLNTQATQILASIDQSIEQVRINHPRLQPVVDWFQTERIRIGPGEYNEIFNQTKVKFQSLGDLLACMMNSSIEINEGNKDEINQL